MGNIKKSIVFFACSIALALSLVKGDSDIRIVRNSRQLEERERAKKPGKARGKTKKTKECHDCIKDNCSDLQCGNKCTKSQKGTCVKNNCNADCPSKNSNNG